MDQPKRIVILGGGFGGVYVAKRLIKQAGRKAYKGTPGGIEVHLVNRQNYMVFQPMLPEVLGGNVGIVDTVTPLRRLVPEAYCHVREVHDVDLANQVVTLAPGVLPHQKKLSYDHLVVALGNVTDFRKMPGLAEYAKPFKMLGDAVSLRNHVIRVLEEADNETDPDVRKELLTFVVGGGGYSGVEAIAELQDFVREAVRAYLRIDIADCRFCLIHSRDLIMPELEKPLAQYAQNLLQKRGIELILNTRLQSAEQDAAICSDGNRIATRTLISTVPAFPNPVIDKMDLPKSKGWLSVDGHLRVEGQENVWALGDCASVPMPTDDPEKPDYAPATAQHATREAVVCADNILASINGGEMRTFDFKGMGSMAGLGRRRAVAQVMGFRFHGIIAWFFWRTVYWTKLPGVYAKVRVGLSWGLDLFFPPDLTQIRFERTAGIQHEHFEPGQAIFSQGEVGRRVYVIVKGKAKVTGNGRDKAGEPETLAELGPGQYFGATAWLKEAPRDITVECTEPLEVLSIERGDFNCLMENIEGLCDNLSEMPPQVSDTVEEAVAAEREGEGPK